MNNAYPPHHAWHDITIVHKQVATKIRHRGLSFIFWWWGILWSLAFALLGAYGDQPPIRWAWGGLAFLGVLGTRFIYHRYGWRVRPKGGELYPGFYWAIMGAYMAAVLWILRPVSLYPVSAALVVMVMWMYMIQGIQTRHPFLPVLAALVSLATLAGYAWLPQAAFPWWMTAVMGLSLVIGGLYRHWKQP